MCAQKLWEQLHLIAIATWAKFLQAQLKYSFCSDRNRRWKNLYEYLTALPAAELFRPLPQLPVWISEIMSLHVYEWRFWGLLCTEYNLGLPSVCFYTAQGKNIILFILTSVGVNVYSIFFLCHLNSITLFCCPFF